MANEKLDRVFYCPIEFILCGSYNTGEILSFQTIAEVVEASVEDYEEGMQACFEAAKIWMQVCQSLVAAKIWF